MHLDHAPGAGGKTPPRGFGAKRLLPGNSDKNFELGPVFCYHWDMKGNMMIKMKLVVLTCVVLLAACQPATGGFNAAETQTQAAPQSPPASPTARPSPSPTPTQRIDPTATITSTASPSATPAASPTETDLPAAVAPGKPDSSGVYTFIDGPGGDVFTAKDMQMSEAWPDRNGGRHRNAQFETHQRLLMEFDLSLIPADATLLDATLYLYHSYEPERKRPVTISIYSIAAGNAAWNAGDKDIKPAEVGESCWNALESDGAGGVKTAWAGSPGLSTRGIDYEPDPIGTFMFDSATPLGTEYAVPLDTQRVQGWLGPANTNYGIIFFTSNNSGHVAQASHSMENLRPRLVVRYTRNTR